MAFRAVSCVAVLFLAAHSVNGYGSGAPNDPGICKSMTPKHPGAPQDTPSPFGLSVNKARVKPGESVELTMKSGSGGEKIKGFLVQGRNSNHDENTTPVGTFEAAPGTKFLSCSDIAKSSITHADNSEKDSFTVTWNAPKEPGTYVLLVTIVQDGLTYWTRRPSQTITVT
ncbi:Ferric-chelate reductase 1 [Orchesella cincta]|uniref:Ferric-chelate reductase 1 n=1 Tax=Orchesella cincta TaxID=48709 RepID=A0A1D2NCC5_ORCCI|nr:Ferric-chelate reductase 1 [Orchesella cincta]